MNGRWTCQRSSGVDHAAASACGPVHHQHAFDGFLVPTVFAPSPLGEGAGKDEVGSARGRLSSNGPKEMGRGRESRYSSRDTMAEVVWAAT